MFLELFDIYKINANGEPFWIGVANTHEEVVSKIQTAHLTDHNCDFYIADLRTGMVQHFKSKESISPKIMRD